MIAFAYAAALLVSLGGLAVLDRRYRLAFWDDPRRAAWTVGLGVVGFLLWDLAGLALGIFARGDSPHMTGLLLAPELPVEEVFFLTLLSYVALLVWAGFERSARLRSARVRALRADRGGPAAGEREQGRGDTDGAGGPQTPHGGGPA